MDNFREDALPQLKSEMNLPIILLRVIVFLVVVIIALIVAILLLFPLKERVPYLVEFKTAKENYVVVKKADQQILSNKTLIHRELKGYVEARENINKIDEARRYADIVRLKSSQEVYQIFYSSFESKKALWDTDGFSRECKITNISDVLYQPQKNNFISIIEFTLFDNYKDGTSTEKNFKATIRYQFVDKKISNEDLTLNPLGTEIIAYQISSVNKNTPKVEL